MNKNIPLAALLFAVIFAPAISRAQTTPAASTPQNQAAASSPQTPAAKPATSSKSSSSQTGTKTGAKPAAKRPVTPVLKTNKDKASYAMGVNVARTLRRQSLDASSVSTTAFMQGLRDVLADRKLALSDQELSAALNELISESRKNLEAKEKAAAAPNREKGAAFLAENKSKSGVVALPSGLQYKILTEGTGPKPTAQDTVACNYRGTLIDGTEFDSSAKHGGKPVTFPVAQVIKGWTEALQLMPVGSKWELYVPAELAYGDHAMGDAIPAGSTLIFQVELVAIQPKQGPNANK